MIKCLNCGDVFSYGRKINCCSSTYFGEIFNNIKKNYQWNCYSSISIKASDKSLIKEIPEIKKYFMRIYTILSKDIREKLRLLNVSKEQKKKIKKELAFLSKDKQIEYLDELLQLNN